MIEPKPLRPGGANRALTPFVAVALALAYLGGALGPAWLLAAVVALTVGALAALALVRRPGRGLLLTVVATTVWLAVGLTVALALRDDPVTGLVATLAVLFVLPLPVIPWLYTRTFEAEPPEPPR